MNSIITNGSKNRCYFIAFYRYLWLFPHFWFLKAMKLILRRVLTLRGVSWRFILGKATTKCCLKIFNFISIFNVAPTQQQLLQPCISMINWKSSTEKTLPFWDSNPRHLGFRSALLPLTTEPLKSANPHRISAFWIQLGFQLQTILFAPQYAKVFLSMQEIKFIYRAIK
jgi:hypothetical protein